MALTDFFATEIATELIKMIFEIWGKLYHCKSNAKQFKCLIKEFLPIIEEIKNSGIELPADRRSQLNQFSETLKYGVELAHKVIDCSPCTVCKRLRLAGELEKLEKNVLRFVSGPMQAHIWADVHHIKYQVEQRFDRLEERLEQLKNGGVAFNSGEKADDKKIEEQIHLISSQPMKKKNGDDEKAKEPPVTTEVLKVALHCQGCINKIRKLVVDTIGVQDCSMDKEKDTVSVKGTIDAKALVEKLEEQLKKKVEVMPPKKKEEKEKVEVEVMPLEKEKEEQIDLISPGDDEKAGKERFEVREWADVHHMKYQVEQRFDRLEERLEQLKNGGVAFNSGKKKIEEQVDLISPQQEKKGNDKKAKEPPVTTEVLKVALHCQVCIDNIRMLVVETKGVHDCSMDKEKEEEKVEVEWGLRHPFHVYKRAQSQLKKKVEVMPPKKKKEKVEVEVMPPKKEEEKVEVKVMPRKKEEEKEEVEVMPPKKEEEEEVEVMPPKKVEVEWGPCHPFHVYNIAQSQLKNFDI